MATNTTVIEIYRNGSWEQAAELLPLGDERCRLEYLADYVFGKDPEPIALGMPVQFTADIPDENGWLNRPVPPFLYDLVPQGKGRKFLLKLLARGDNDNLVLPLLLAGAFNPIGRLRIASAVDFFKDQASKSTEQHLAGALTLDDIRLRSDEYLDHISVHSMLATGTTGVQGVAPKYLMAQNREGRWFSDLALPDDQATAHWLMKLPRGKSDADRAVLRNEAAYLRLAGRCGLRAPSGDLGLDDGVMLVDELLFIRRFDRQVIDGGVHRLHQESMASVAGLRGFAPGVTLNALLKAMREHATHPMAETAEFMKRDVLNRAMRNTDNHARNTAMQRLPDGTIQLTPVFDFAPMFMDPEGIARSVEWRDAKGVIQREWPAILRELAATGIIAEREHAALAEELKAFGSVVAQLPGLATACGVEKPVLDQCLASIDAQANQLTHLPA